MVRTFNSGDDYGRPIFDEVEAACEAESKTESHAPQHENDMHYSSCQVERIADSYARTEDTAVKGYDTTFDEAQSQWSQDLKDI